MTIQTTDNKYGVAKWIVDKVLGRGTHTSISGAITSASDGDTIMVRASSTPYTEDLTLKAGVNLVAFECDAYTPNVTIIGKMTATFTGQCTISGIRVQTNSDFFLVNSGSNATIVRFVNCFLNCSNNTGFSFTNSNASSAITIRYCNADVTTTGISLFASSSAGNIQIFFSDLRNTGSSTTNSTISAGSLLIYGCNSNIAITGSGTSSAGVFDSTVNTASFNITAFTADGSGTNNAISSSFFSGTASAISVGSGATLTASGVVINSTNTNAITGLGTLIYSGINFSNTSSLMNTSVLTSRATNTGSISFDGGTNLLSTYTVSTFTPTLVGNSTAGTTTYVAQNGYYTRIGNLVTCIGYVQISAATGTGNALFGGLPFTVKNQTNGVPTGSVTCRAAGWAWPVGSSSLAFLGTVNNTTAIILTSGTAFGGNILQMANAAAIFNYTLTYQI